MSLTLPYRQHNYCGENANDAACLTFIRGNKWDSNSNGTGNPRNGMWYYNSTSHTFRGYQNGAWADLGGGGDVPSRAYNSYSSNQTISDSNDVIEVTASGVTITLHAVSTAAKKNYDIKNTSSGNITIDGNSSEEIDGETSITVGPDENYTIFPTGTKWLIL